VDRKSKYHSQASYLVRAHQSFQLNTNTRIGHLRNNFTMFINRLNFLWFLNLVFFILFFYSCIINDIITILLSLFSHTSLSLFLYYNLLFSLPITLSATTHLFFPLTSSPSSNLPQPITTLSLPPTHSQPADKPTEPTAQNTAPCNP
jgi:hypothetical protein